jgi:hypothetical protein
MKTNTKTIYKKILLSSFVFVASIAATIIVGGFLLNTTQLETNVADNFFTEINNLEELENQVKVTQEVKIIQETPEVTETDDTDNVIPDESDSDSNPTDETNPADLTKYSSAEVNLWLNGKEFPFQTIEKLKLNSLNESQSTISYLDELIAKLEDTQAPNPINEDVKKLVEGMKLYRDLVSKYEDTFTYLDSLNQLFTNYLNQDGIRSLEELQGRVNELVAPEDVKNYNELFLKDLEAIRNITLEEEIQLNREAQMDSTTQTQALEEPIETAPSEEDIPDSNTDSTEDNEENIILVPSINLKLKSTSENYTLALFFEEKDRAELDKSIKLISTSIANINAYKRSLATEEIDTTKN